MAGPIATTSNAAIAAKDPRGPCQRDNANEHFVEIDACNIL